MTPLQAIHCAVEGVDAKRSAAVALSSPAAAQRCAEGAGLDSGAVVAAQSVMPSIAAPDELTANKISTGAVAFMVTSVPVPNLHQLDGRDPRQRPLGNVGTFP